jgi:hypothetical protein
MDSDSDSDSDFVYFIFSKLRLRLRLSKLVSDANRTQIENCCVPRMRRVELEICHTMARLHRLASLKTID